MSAWTTTIAGQPIRASGVSRPIRSRAAAIAERDGQAGGKETVPPNEPHLEVVAKEVETLRAGSRVDDPGFRLGQGQPEFPQHLPKELQGGFGLPAGPTEDHEIVCVADEFAQVPTRLLPRLVQAVQIDVCQHRRDNPTLGRSRLGMEQPFLGQDIGAAANR